MLLDLQPKKQKKKRKLSILQAYSKKHFDEKLRDIKEARYTEHLKLVEEGVETKMKPLQHYNKLLQELWDEEPDDVREAVIKFREDPHAGGASSDEDGEDDTSDEDDEVADDDEQDSDEDPPKRKGEHTSKGRKGKEPLKPADAKATEYHKYVSQA